MPEVAQTKTKSVVASKPATKSTSSGKPAAKSFRTLLNEAIQAKSYEKLDKAIAVMTVDDLISAAKDPNVISGLKSAFGKDFSVAFSQSLSNPKTAWEAVKKFGSAVWNKGVDFLNWANKTLTTAISTHVSKKHIMDIYSALSSGNLVAAPVAWYHYLYSNPKALKEGKQIENATKGKTVSTTTGYIENQGYGEWDKIKYGYSNLKNAGCGIFATFNVMKAVTGVTPTADDLVDIIYTYERDGNIAGGCFGTSPKAIRKYLGNKGYTVETVNDYTNAKLNSIGNSYKGFVTLKLNDKADITAGGHYECISKEAKTSNDRANDKDDNARASNYKFSVHNGSKRGPHNSMPKTIDVINSGNAMVFCILAVNKALNK